MAINNLPKLTSADEIALGDIAAQFSQAGGEDVGVAWSKIITFLNANLTFPGDDAKEGFFKQRETPVTGGTITPDDNGDDDSNFWIIISPAGALAALTIKAPAVASAVDNQEMLVICTQAITTLTLDANGATSIINGPAALTANQTFKLKYDLQTKIWYNIQAP